VSATDVLKRNHSLACRSRAAVHDYRRRPLSSASSLMPARSQAERTTSRSLMLLFRWRAKDSLALFAARFSRPSSTSFHARPPIRLFYTAAHLTPDAAIYRRLMLRIPERLAVIPFSRRERFLRRASRRVRAWCAQTTTHENDGAAEPAIYSAMVPACKKCLPNHERCCYQLSSLRQAAR